MQDQDKDKSKPAIPNLRETPKPQVKIKGLTGAQSTLIERLKAFKKKDLAFILAGLGVLFMAPLAEHFMMSPDAGEAGAFKEGWGFRGAGEFGKGGSPYEGGITGLAPGSVAGGGSDVITPLNARDPSSLIMGPGGTPQPPTSATPSASKESGDWKDALANAASKGAQAAGKAASLPTPHIPLTNAGVRGLGAISGGSGANYSLPPISASNVPNRAAESRSPAPQAAAGYKGVARGPNTASTSGFEALKKVAGEAGGDLNRGGSAAGDLQTAAGRDMNQPTSGGGGAGEGANGGGDKAGGGNQNKDSKNEGESLAFMKAKAEQEKAIELEWKLKEWKAMLWPDIEKKMLESMMTKISDMIGELGAATIKSFLKPGGPTTYNCVPMDVYNSKVPGDIMAKQFPVKDDDIANCGETTGKEDKGAQHYYAYPNDRQNLYTSYDCKGGVSLWCTGAATSGPSGPSGSTGGQVAENATAYTGAQAVDAQFESDFGDMCIVSANILRADRSKDSVRNPLPADIISSKPVYDNYREVALHYPRAINLLMGAQRAMDGTQSAQDCAESLSGDDKVSLKKMTVESDEKNIRGTLLKTHETVFAQGDDGGMGVLAVLDHALGDSQTAVDGLMAKPSSAQQSALDRSKPSTAQKTPAAADFLPPAKAILDIINKSSGQIQPNATGSTGAGVADGGADSAKPADASGGNSAANPPTPTDIKTESAKLHDMIIGFDNALQGLNTDLKNVQAKEDVAKKAQGNLSKVEKPLGAVGNVLTNTVLPKRIVDMGSNTELAKKFVSAQARVSDLQKAGLKEQQTLQGAYDNEQAAMNKLPKYIKDTETIVQGAIDAKRSLAALNKAVDALPKVAGQSPQEDQKKDFNKKYEDATSLLVQWYGNLNKTKTPLEHDLDHPPVTGDELRFPSASDASVASGNAK